KAQGGNDSVRSHLHRHLDLTRSRLIASGDGPVCGTPRRAFPTDPPVGRARRPTTTTLPRSPDGHLGVAAGPPRWRADRGRLAATGRAVPAAVGRVGHPGRGAGRGRRRPHSGGFAGGGQTSRGLRPARGGGVSRLAAHRPRPAPHRPPPPPPRPAPPPPPHPP